MPGVRIYPYKEVETGSQIFESLIWESRGTTRIFRKQGVSGLVNVDLTPDVAVRLASALGTALKRGARVVASREGAPACRMIKRAMISGLASTGVARRRPARHPRRRRAPPREGGGLRRRLPRRHQPERPRGGAHPVLRGAGNRDERRDAEGGREALHARRAAARSRRRRSAAISYPARVQREATRATCSSTLDVEAIRARALPHRRRLRLLRRVVRPAARARRRSASRWSRRTRSRARRTPAHRATSPTSIGQAKRLVAGDRRATSAPSSTASGERLYLVDEQAREIPVEQALLLYLRLIGSNGRHGKLAFPVTVTSQVDRLDRGLAARDRAHARVAPGADPGGGGGRRRLRRRASAAATSSPSSCPGYDAVASLAKLLELLAPVERPLSELVAELPRPDPRPPPARRARGG